MTRRFTPPTAVESYASLLEPYAGCRRSSERAPCRIPAELTRTTGEKAVGRIEQLSEGGALFAGSLLVAPGESAELRFPEPVAGRIVMVRVTCRWSSPSRGKLYAAGFEFWDSPSPPRELFRTYVAMTREASKIG